MISVPASAARLFLAREEECQQIAQQLHDTAAQALALLSLHLDLANTGGSGAASGDMRAACHEAIRSVRAVISELQNPAFQAPEVEPVLRRLLKRQASAQAIEFRWRAEGLDHLSPSAALLVYRLVQTLLSDHSGPVQNALKITVRLSDKQLRVAATSTDLAGLSRLEIRCWPDRIALLGGTMRVRQVRNTVLAVVCDVPSEILEP